MLLRQGVLLVAVVITVIYLLGLTASLEGASLDDSLLNLGLAVMILGWIAWIGVAVRDSIIEHIRAAARIRRPDR